MSEKPTVVVHIDALGNHNYLICGDVRLLVIDECAPNDRVYEMLDGAISEGQLAKLIGSDTIGSKDDERHAAISARVLAGMAGERHLKVVHDEVGQ